MSKLSNVLLLIDYLQTGRKYTITELAEKLEVSPRMVRSYKEELEKAGIYIDTIMGPYGGYVLNQSIRLPARKFKKQDYELLEKYIQAEPDSKQKEQLLLLKDKIQGVYIGSKKEAKELNLTETVQRKYNLLTRAIKERKKVKITYYSYNKGENNLCDLSC